MRKANLLYLFLSLLLALLCLPPLAASERAPQGEEAKVAEYVKLLTNKNTAVRKQAAVALGEMGAKAKSAVAALREALLDADEGVQTAAAVALEKIDGGGMLPKEFVAELQKLRRQLDEARARAEDLAQEARKAAEAAAAREKRARDEAERVKAVMKARDDELQDALDKQRLATKEKDEAQRAAQGRLELAEKEAARLRTLMERTREDFKKAQDQILSQEKVVQAAREAQAAAEINAKKLQERNERLLKELEDLTKEVERLRKGGAAPADRNPPPEDVQGTVKSVDPSGLVLITIGSDAGLQKGHTLEVYRMKPQPKYLGSIRIVDVRPNEAVARVVGKPAAPLQAGDNVASKLMPNK